MHRLLQAKMQCHACRNSLVPSMHEWKEKKNDEKLGGTWEHTEQNSKRPLCHCYASIIKQMPCYSFVVIPQLHFQFIVYKCKWFLYVWNSLNISTVVIHFSSIHIAVLPSCTATPPASVFCWFLTSTFPEPTEVKQWVAFCLAWSSSTLPSVTTGIKHRHDRHRRYSQD